MRFMIYSDTRDGLRVINEIPNIPTCMLEGQNGVGKTVAIQLLQLISGEIPEIFTTRPGLWMSLRDRLGATSVQIDELQDGRQLKLAFSPTQWNETPPDTIGEWLGVATIDGKPAKVAECSRLLSVIRIAGDEDLEDTLRRRVNILTAQFRSAASLVRARGAQIEKLLAGIVSDFQRIDPTDIEADEALLRSHEDELDKAQAGAEVADQVLQSLLRALETERRLEAVGVAADALMSRRDELISEVRALETELEVKEAAADKAEDALSAGGDPQKKLADAEKALRYRRTRVANLERDTKRLSTALAVGASVEEATRALEVVSADLAILQERHKQMDNTALVRNLIEEVTPPIKNAEVDAADRVLVRTVEGGLTVSQTLSGLTLRHQELADQPQPSELRELAAQIDALDRRQRDLYDLGEKLQALRTLQERVQVAKQEAEDASQQAELASEAAQLVRETHQAIGAVQESLTKAHAELATVLQQISGMGATSKEDAEVDLQAALESLELERDQLDEAEGAARRRLAEADSKVIELTKSVNAIRRSLTTRRTEVGLLIDRLLGSSRYRWLVDATPDLSSRLVNADTRYKAFAQLRKAVLDADEVAYRSAQFLENLVGIAEGFFTNVQPEPDNELDLPQDLRPAFEAVIGKRLRDTLNRPSIRDAVFDGSKVVAVEAGTRQLFLQDAQGRISHRPMEGFSSGERAYAFTQARIADLEPSDKPNRLLVLDEFGAYVAADRLPDLADFLKNEVQGIVADQVIVILPLHVDYRNELSNTVGELRARYEERLEQIEQRGYCAVELTW